jgi:hypothetical protein
MRKLAICLCLIFTCLCVTSCCMVAPDEAEEAAQILAIVDQQFEDFNRHDVEALIAPAADDYQNWDCSVTSKAAKRVDILSLFDSYPTIHGERIKYSITFVTPEVAIYKDIARFSYGTVQMPDYEIWAGIWVKKNGEWVEVASFCTEISEEDVAGALNCEAGDPQ